MKKHINDFTQAEKEMVSSRLQAVRSLEKCQHCIDRMHEKRISSDEMMRVFKDYDIIEYHNRNGSHRILLRGRINEKGRNICLVVDIDSGSIVTTYANQNSDHHFTLREEEYDRTIDLVDVLSRRVRITEAAPCRERRPSSFGVKLGDAFSEDILKLFMNNDG